MSANSNSNLSSSSYDQFVLDMQGESEKIVFLKIGASVSAQKLSDNIWIIRGYKDGENVPSSHEWVTVFKLDPESSKYEPFAFTSTIPGSAEKIIRPHQFRAVHKFFRGMGFKNFVYYRDKGGLGWITRQSK